jgi:hypothetical protein
MPWKIEKGQGKCSPDQWSVVKEDGEVKGCHDSRESALKQLRALYASEGK